MSTKINEFIASLVDASIPEEQQSFLLNSTDNDAFGGDNSGNSCSNFTAACTGTNNNCTNYGRVCDKSLNTGDCKNVDNRFDTNSDYTCTGPIKP